MHPIAMYRPISQSDYTIAAAKCYNSFMLASEWNAVNSDIQVVMVH